MIGDLALAALVLAILLWAIWAIVVFLTKKNARPIVLPLSEKLSAFRAAYERFGVVPNDTALLEIHKDILSKFENPYLAAVDSWCNLLGRLNRPGGEAYFGSDGRKARPTGDTSEDASPVDNDKEFGLVTICEFVLENRISSEHGKQYFDRVAGIARDCLAREGNSNENVASFDSLLEKTRVRLQSTLVSR